MKIFLVLLSLNSSFSQVPLPNSEVWAIGKMYYPFERDKATNALISQECSATKKCEAYKAVLNKSKIKLSESDRSGGKNPGAVTCKKIYGGEVLVLRDVADNENSFCKFKDKSLVSASDIF